MSILEKKLRAERRRATRVRSKVRGTADRPRLSVFRSNRGICGSGDRRLARSHACDRRAV